MLRFPFPRYWGNWHKSLDAQNSKENGLVSSALKPSFIWDEYLSPSQGILYGHHATDDFDSHPPIQIQCTVCPDYDIWYRIQLNGYAPSLYAFLVAVTMLIFLMVPKGWLMLYL